MGGGRRGWVVVEGGWWMGGQGTIATMVRNSNHQYEYTEALVKRNRGDNHRLK